MRSRFTILLYMLLLMLASTLPVSFVTTQEQYGPAIDKVRSVVVKSPDAQLIGMLTEYLHFLPDLMRTDDIDALDASGFTILSAPGFQMGHIGFNIRSDQSYRTDRLSSELPTVARILSDVNFRHAVLHSYDQDGILASIYGYVVNKSTSLVPPSYGCWESSTVPTHPFNQGNPFTSPPGEHSSCGILKAAGYTFVDAGTIGVVDPADHWTLDGVALPTLRLILPLPDVSPTSYQHGAEIINDLHAIGLNNMMFEGLAQYYTYVFQNAEFDMYMAMWGDDFQLAPSDGWWRTLGRFPDYLYDVTHSTQDSQLHPWRYNAPGINDPYVDALAETVKFGLNSMDQLTAALELQDYLYDPDLNPQAFPYMQLYSRNLFSAGNPKLRGLVDSHGFGADNMWTWLNWHWNPGEEYIEDGKTTIIYTLGDEPERLNPLYASSTYAWMIMGPTLDGLMTVDPYLHEDLPWLVDGWTVTSTATDMEVTFDLASGVEWQDGKPYTAEDVRFNWLFLRDNQIPRYKTVWEHIVDVQIITPGAGGVVKVVLDTPSHFLIYDLAATAALLPPPVWSWLDGKPLAQILEYEPSTNATKPTDAGPRFGTVDGPNNQLFGTGPYIFQFYDQVSMYAEFLANRHYFRTTTSIQSQLAEMFHRAGDVDRNGIINVSDMTRIGMAYGSRLGEPGYDPDADLNADGIIDTFDFIAFDYFLSLQRTYPYGSTSHSSPVSSAEGSLRLLEEGTQSLETLSMTGSSSAEVSVKPELVKDETLKPGTYFAVDINITNGFDLTGLKGCEFRLTFNASVLNVDSIIAGDFLKEPHTWKKVANNVAGFAWFGANSGRSEFYGSMGSGRLATIRFKVVGYNQTSLKLKGSTKLANARGKPVSHTAFDGGFDNRIAGDANGDGEVDVFDLFRVGRSYEYSSGQPQFDEAADLNGDGIVDIDDLRLVADNWGNKDP